MKDITVSEGHSNNSIKNNQFSAKNN